MGQFLFHNLLLHLWAFATLNSPVSLVFIEEKNLVDSKLRSETTQYFTMESIVKGQNEFNWDMFKLALAKDGAKNIFFSPYSIASASSMVLTGARGNTKTEIEKAFHFQKVGTETDFLKGSKKLLDDVAPKSPKVRFDVANKVFVDNGTNLLDAYSSNLKTYFNSEVGIEEFAKAPEKSREKINSWVESKTEQKIQELFPSGSLSAATHLVLANAVYFKGQWSIPFDANDTHEGEFHLDSGDTVKCNMMWKNAKFPMHFDNELLLNIVMLPYAGDEVDFIAAVPQSGGFGFPDFDVQDDADDDAPLPLDDIPPAPLDVKLSDLMKKISADTISAWVQKLQDRAKGFVRDIDVFIPKFKVSFDMNLKEYLKGLGINDLFNESADLSGMNGKRNLFCDSAIHKAFIEVIEEGTEASAATGMAMNLMSMPTQVMFDRPFFYFIVHRQSNAIIFSGKMNNPNM